MYFAYVDFSERYDFGDFMITVLNLIIVLFR